MHNSDLEYLAELCGKPRRIANGYMCCCPAHNDSTPSLSLSMAGDTLLAHCFAGCSFEEVAELLGEYGVNSRISRNDCCYEEQKAEDKRGYAQKIWDETQSAKGTPVETYLRARGYTGDIPDSIGYHPRLKHVPSGKFLPAMVSAVTLYPIDEIVAIHRTYLKPDGSGKAEVEPNKMMLGSIKGGAVIFGPQAGLILHVAEGIETALSIFLATGMPTWAALSASNMRNLVLPPVDSVPRLYIDADADVTGLLAAKYLGDREYIAGRTVRLAASEDSGIDFNDLLMR